MKVLNSWSHFWKSLWQKNSKSDSIYYSSTHELPVYNWFELNKTGDLKLLLKNPEKHDLDDRVVTAYYTLKDEYFEQFGVPEEYERHLSSMRYYGLLMAKYLESGGERSMLTGIRIAKSKFSKTNEPLDYSKMWAQVIATMATVPDIKTFPTFDFMSIYRNLQHGQAR